MAGAPVPRSFHRATAVSNRLYVFGGCGADGRLADLHEYCADTERWTEMPRPPDLTGRGGATLEPSADGASLWLLAGFAGHETNDVLRFCLSSRTWHRVPSDWLRARSVCASLTFGGKTDAVVLFGGEVAPSDHGHEGAGCFAADTIAIDPRGGTPLHVSVDGDAPPARGWAAATALSPTVGVLFGGLAGDDKAPSRLDDAWVLRIGEPMASL